MRESIFSTSIRSFFKTLFAMLGIGLGIMLISALAAVFINTENQPETTFTPEIYPNAEGSRKVLSSSAPVILKVNIKGVIGTENLSMQSVRRLLVESREGTFKDNRVKAVILNIESPGGTVIDADGIYHALLAYKEMYKVPVYAYVDGLCASGGMYVASAADKIFASSISLIGSVGVIAPSFLNFTQLMDKIGVQALTLSAGKGKDELNPLRPWKPGEEDALKSIIEYYYHDFVNIVTSARPALSKEKLIEEYGAHVFPAPKAQEYGFIDVSGYSFNEALKELLKKIGIEDQFYQVYQLENKNWLNTLLNGNFSLLKGEVKHKLQLGNNYNPELMDQFLYLYRSEQ